MSGNDEQRAFWTDGLGPLWVSLNTDFDAAYAPLSDALIRAADIKANMNVLDIGSGTGALTRAAAATGARATGVDISTTMVDAAHPAPGTSFRVGDAQSDPFDDGPFDSVISRFGVMFFDDNASAFANIRRAMVPGGTLTCASWGTRAQNPWFTIPTEAAVDRLGPGVPGDPLAPGPFAFADPDRVIDILKHAGFGDISVQPTPMRFAPQSSARETAGLIAQTGPARSLMQEKGGTPDDIEIIQTAIEAALVPHYREPEPGVPALINMISATAP